MTTRILAFLALLAALAAPARAEHIAVIVHPDSPLLGLNLTTREVTDLFLGRPLAGSIRPVVVEQQRDSTLRANFYMRLNGMDLSRVNAYWARLQFSGQMQPPFTLPDSRHVIDYVRNHPLAIGYVEDASLTGDVRPLLLLKN